VAGLAAFLGEPVLFAERAFVPPATLSALRDLGVRTVTVVGGRGAVSAIVVVQLQAAGVLVERLGGDAPGAAAAAVAARAVASGQSANQVWVVGGWPAAVAGGAASAGTGDALVAVDGGDQALGWLTANRRLLTALRLAGGVDQAAVTRAVTGP